MYLRDWENGAHKRNLHFPISASTLVGLKVTLGGTLELLKFLVQECFYAFLMTGRLTQDALEVPNFMHT